MAARGTTLHADSTAYGRFGRAVTAFPGAVAATALLLGDLVLIGWRSGIEAFKTVIPGSGAMNPTSAMAVALAGLSLWFLRDERRDPREIRLGRAFAAVVMWIGSLRLIGYLAGAQRGVDTLFLADKLELPPGGFWYRMAPTTALCCVLLGASLVTLDVATRPGRRPARFLSVTACLIALAALVRCAFGAGAASGSLADDGMAVHAAATLFLLGLGTFCARPPERLYGLWAGESRAETAHPPAPAALVHARVALRSIAEEVIADLHDETAGRAIEWHVGALPEVEADGAMLRHVFVNLIGDAVKHSRSRERAVIEIGSIEQDRKEAVIFVRDNGVGFDMQHADELFTGTGIGLANVRSIVERHGGRTWAEGRPDRGAIFYFSLPGRVGAKARAS